MFLENKYTRIYFSIIERSKLREDPTIIEKHHIIPKSLGGDNNYRNIAKLTPKEHFICHRLLIKMTNGENRQKMSYAIWSMCRQSKKHKRIIAAHQYEYAKIQFKKANSKRKVSTETREKLSRANKGRKAPWVAITNKKMVESENYKNGNQKVWSITTPSGTNLVIENLAKFCRENNLSMGNLTAAGKTKGYTAVRLGKSRELEIVN